MNPPIQDFQYKISLGQNFIFDEALLSSLVEQAPLKPGDAVLEIGAGRGDLTLMLAKKAGQVIALEIDERLEKVLLDRFSRLDNIRLVMGDVMKTDLGALMEPYGVFHVVANLPYYLTTPILSMLFRTSLPVLSVSVMVQKEAAQRVLAKPGTPEYGPLAVMAALRGRPYETIQVPAACFTPPPKVDSAFLVIPFIENPLLDAGEIALFERVVDSAFFMRRKTLLNNLMKTFNFTRQQALNCLSNLGIDEKARGETLDLDQFIALYRQIKNEIN